MRIEEDVDGMYIGSVPSLKDCHSHGKTYKELMTNLKEAILAHSGNVFMPPNTPIEIIEPVKRTFHNGK